MLDDLGEERSRFGAQVYIGLALCAGIVAWLAYVTLSKVNSQPWSSSQSAHYTIAHPQ
jgi:hypothetical protein